MSFRTSQLVLLWTVLICWCAQSAQAAALDISPDDEVTEVGRFVHLYEDVTGTLSFEEILDLDPKGAWRPTNDPVPNLGYTDSTYWVRLDLDFSKFEDAERWLLEVAWPHIESIRFYLLVSDGSRYEEVAGLAIPFSARAIEHRNPVFRLERVAGSQASVYLAVQGGNALQLPLRLWTRNGFLKADHHGQYVLGFVYGMFLVMLLYSLALFGIFREQAYLHYVWFTASLGLLLFTVDQLAFEYLWPEFTWWAPRAVLVLSALTGITCLLFFRSYLTLSENWPKGDLIFKRCQYALALGLFIPFVVEHAWAALYCLGLAAFGALLGIVAVVRGLLRGDRSAAYLMWAWGPFLLGVLLIILRNFQILPAIGLTNYGFQIGASLGVFGLAVAVALRVRDDDVKSRRALEEVHAQARATMGEREQNLGEKSEFLERVSHEMQVSLNAIVNIPSALLGDYSKVPVWVCPGCEAVFEAPHHPADQKSREACPECGNDSMRLDEDIVCEGTPFEHIRMLERLEGDARELLSLVHNVLSYSGAAEEHLVLNITTFSLREFFEDIQDAVGKEASDKLMALDFHGCSSSDEVRADRDKLLLIMVNLVQNAIKFTPKRGQVDVQWALAEAGNGLSQVLRVRDNGMGVPKAELEHIFARFTQAAVVEGARRQGSGLGLAVARKLVDLHGGEISVESKVGQGSVFLVSIPKPA